MSTSKWLPLLAVPVALVALLMPLLPRRFGWLVTMFFVLGCLIGLVLCYLSWLARKEKRVAKHSLNIQQGDKMHAARSDGRLEWCKVPDEEQAEWLNEAVAQMWPCMDGALCDMIKDFVYHNLNGDDVKPPFVKHVDVSKFYPGEVPVRITAVRMDRQRKDGVFLEFDFDWESNAQVNLAITLVLEDFVRLVQDPARTVFDGYDTLVNALSMIPGVGGMLKNTLQDLLSQLRTMLRCDLRHAMKLHSRIHDIRFKGKLGLHLRRLGPHFTGFGAAVLTLLDSPDVSYEVDLGPALGGTIVHGGLRTFMKSLIPMFFDDFLVCPERVVVPLWPRDVTGPLNDLRPCPEGILKVKVSGVTASLSRNDRTWRYFADIFADPKHKRTTKETELVSKPHWDEIFYVIVQEPSMQKLKCEIFKRKRIRIPSVIGLLKFFYEAIREGVFVCLRNAELETTRSVCKAKTLLKDICDNAGTVFEDTLSLTSSNESPNGSAGGDRGGIGLTLCYRPLQACYDLGTSRAQYKAGTEVGVLIVQLEEGRYFPEMGEKNLCSPYVVGTAGGIEQKIPTLFDTCDPRWEGARMEFHGCTRDAMLTLQFNHRQDRLDLNVGKAEIEVEEVAQACIDRRDPRGCLSIIEKPINNVESTVTLDCWFVPYF